MQIDNSFIIIKGEPKTFQIEEISLGEHGVYNVKFKSSATIFHYRNSDVVCLTEAIWHDNKYCKVFVNGKERTDVEDIRSYQHDDQVHWRIKYNKGNVHDYKHGTITVTESCLADEVARNTFDYLKRIAFTNELGKDEEHEGILSTIYEKINFIDKSLVVAPYLYPQKNKVKTLKASSLIFPFGCNASQEKAVTTAFENQLSVIQGPPGTGKTQTILNIIANILMQGQTVMVVSNNNSATTNIQEKLQKYGLDFIVASLGSRDNKEAFIINQPSLPEDMVNWKLDLTESFSKNVDLTSTLTKLRKVFELQEDLALSKQEFKDIDIEWIHFKQDNNIEDGTYKAKSGIKSKRLLSIWLQYQAYAEGDIIAPKGIFGRFREWVRWTWINFNRKHLLGIKSKFDDKNLQPIIVELQALYYLVKLEELNERISKLEKDLSVLDGPKLNADLVSTSMELLKDALCRKYNDKDWITYSSAQEIKHNSEDFLNQYPVVLSTTFSAKTSLSDKAVFDYLIMDEASQVSIETGALAMACAKNAVIVGDTLQLPNVVTSEDKLKYDAIFNEYKVHQGYNCSEYSFLKSVCTVIPEVKQTLLREHYRCHPRIINFCNKKFYGGDLLIMTDDKCEKDVMLAIKTIPGSHCRGHYNQREIDVVKHEILSDISEPGDIGIITPYNAQVDAFNCQIPSFETATVHKYQGREKDTIIMSTVDDQITAFSDDPNLLNVAISRAKKKFCIVLSGNEQEHRGNICELVDYINYNNFSVIESKISSIFDYLYSQYTEQRISFLSRSKTVSEFDSENLTYKLLSDIISKYPEFQHLGILCHTPIRTVFRNWSLMNDEEKQYVSHYATHLDFLLVNHVTKKPVLAIETDGYYYHNKETDQHRRDIMKDHILEVYELPLLRLSTTGSGEFDKILSSLKNCCRCY